MEFIWKGFSGRDALECGFHFLGPFRVLIVEVVLLGEVFAEVVELTGEHGGRTATEGCFSVGEDEFPVTVADGAFVVNDRWAGSGWFAGVEEPGEEADAVFRFSF